jgi:hypothetical protein
MGDLSIGLLTQLWTQLTLQTLTGTQRYKMLTGN